MNVPLSLLRMTATVATYGGVDGRNEALLGDPVSFRCFAEHRSRLIRSAQTGQEVRASTTVYAQLTAAGGAAAFPPRSVITLPGGRTTEVIECAERTGAGLPTPDHLEIICA